MALPQKINRADPSDSDNPSAGASVFRQLKTFLQDVFGLTDNTDYTAAAFAITTAGLVTVKQHPFTLDTGVGLIVKSTGPHVIGAASAVTANGILLVTAATAASAYGAGMLLRSTVTAAANNDVLAGFDVGQSGGVTFASGTFTGLTAALIRLAGTNLLKTGTGTIANAAALLIVDAPTVGTANYAILVSAGTSRFVGQVNAVNALVIPVGTDKWGS